MMETACSHSELDYRIKQWEKKLRDLSLEIVKSGNKKIPCLLLQVKSYLDDEQLHTKEYPAIKKLLWKYKFFQAILVFLKRDYRVDGGWTTAAKLSRLLSQICTGVDFADSVEFKDDCLPTADRNMLMLAVRIHDDLMESSLNARDVLINDFRTVLDALIYLTSGYAFLVKPVLTDENLLKLLMTDDVVIGTEIINLIRTILRLNWHVLKQLDSKIIHTFLDEIIYKLSVYTEPKIQIASCNCILEFCEHYPALIDLLCTKYKGLRIILMKQAEKIHCRELKPLLVLLNAGSSERVQKQKHHQAVEKIQSAWRGYITRKKLKKANEAISKLQKCYLSRKETREKEQENLRELSQKNEQMQSFQLLKMRSFREKQLQKMELTPAYQILKYQAEEMENAAICIQKNWRGYRIRCQQSKFHTEYKQRRAAIIIQRAVRRWLKRTKSNISPIPTKLKPQTLTEERRTVVQQQITDWREIHSKKLGSFEEQKRLHQKASELLQQFYNSLQASRKRLLHNKALLARLDVDSESLINAPKLESVTEKDIDIYSSPSLPISTKAKIAHKKALKKIAAPWWQKLEDSDEEEDIALNDTSDCEVQNL
ncbi:calmodulin-binding motif-containing 1-like [Octopus vulgaris]|uniref:Calmodulin-binding motif-containing 1-like n=1 Tax=Octopus vulgaris TaxID=6645 RepID=A0AA36AQN3_OCTVU|nr:calmodulin-binding motif-containing 1-like [Octopus vulgaris]